MTTATFGPITSLCVGARTPEGLERIMRDLASEGAQSHISAADRKPLRYRAGVSWSGRRA